MKQKRRKPVHPSRELPPCTVPPWVTTPEDIASKYWLGSKALVKPWIQDKIDAYVADESIYDWKSYFAGATPREVSVLTVNQLLRIFVARKQPKKALKVFDEMKSHGVEPDRHAYMFGIRACTMMQDLPRANALFDEFSQHGDVNAEVYSSMMTCYTECGQPEECQNLMNEAKRRGISPSREMFTALITSYGVKGKLEEVLQIFLEMRSHDAHPDKITYNAVLFACARAGDGYKALDIMDEMEECAIPRDVNAYNSVIKACVESGLSKEAVKLFDHMLYNKTIGDGSLAPTLQTYCFIVEHYAGKGDLESAISMVAFMREEGLTPDSKVFAGMIEACQIAAFNEPVVQMRVAWAEKGDKMFEEAMQTLGDNIRQRDFELLVTKTVQVWPFE